MQNSVVWLDRREDANLVFDHLNHTGANRNLRNCSHQNYPRLKQTILVVEDPIHVGIVRRTELLMMRIPGGCEIVFLCLLEINI